MKYRYLLVIVTVLFVTQAYAQRSQKGSYNRLGIQAGAQLFDINTDNFITNKAVGFTGGFTTRGSFYNYFDLIYGVDFFDLSKRDCCSRRRGGSLQCFCNTAKLFR